MEQPQDHQCESTYTNGIECFECNFCICDCGKCHCQEAFAPGEVNQREREYYKTRFVDLLKYFIQTRISNLFPQNQDRFEIQVGNLNLENQDRYEQRQGAAGTEGRIFKGIFYHVNGLKIELYPEYIAFNEPEARQSCNGTGSEELRAPISGNHPDIVNSSSDNATIISHPLMAVEDNSARRFLRLRLTSVSQYDYECVYLDILGDNLDWRHILQDVEANTLELRWAFYKGTDRLQFEFSEDDSNVSRIVEEFEVEEYDYSNVHSASKSAIENMPTYTICRDQGTENCSICKFEMAVDQEVTELPCNHLHHSECIIKWLESNNTCPLCRFELPIDDPNPISKICRDLW